MAKLYLSKNYVNTTSAGNKAKIDVERILAVMGYTNAGLPKTTCRNEALGFFITLVGVLKMVFTVRAGDEVFIQYPLKKYYSFACDIVRAKRGKVITVVHDLGTYRRKRISKQTEMRKLNHSDCLLVHNDNMKGLLLSQGYSKPMVCLWLWDYLSPSTNTTQRGLDTKSIKVLYAGTISYRKNMFLYKLGDDISTWRLLLYGNGFEEGRIRNKDKITYNGYCPSDELIEKAQADYGLLWDGDSTIACAGDFGEYLKINNPHKVSLYIRCHLPIIAWEKAAITPFIIENNIGISVASLNELDGILPSISKGKYTEMVGNVKAMSDKIASGFFLKQALSKI